MSGTPDPEDPDATAVWPAGAAGRSTRVVGAALLDAARRPTHVLAAQRAYPAELRGLWEFPGGKQEPGESALDALVRECREELDLRIRLLDEVTPPAPDGWPLAGTAVMRVFTAVVDNGGSMGSAVPDPVSAPTDQDEPTSQDVHAGPGTPVFPSGDHLEVRWLPLADPAQILGLPWIPADLPIVAALLEMLRTE